MNVLKSPWNVHWYFGCFLFANSLHHPQAHWLHMGVSPRCNWPLFIHTGVSKVAVCRVKVRRSQERRAIGEPQNIRGDVGFESKMIFPWIFLGWFLGEAYGSYQGVNKYKTLFYSKKLTNTIPENKKLEYTRPHYKEKPSRFLYRLCFDTTYI